MSWCDTEYHDLFAVGYGSFDFMKQTSGLICCYSLKNPSHPEYTFTTESGVMALDFHPQHSSLLAVGLYDGSVMVFDVCNKVNKPIFASSVKTGKHTDPVWQVSWQPEDEGTKEVKFFSVSSDGRVTQVRALCPRCLCRLSCFAASPRSSKIRAGSLTCS